jgi:hypothetical protein
MSKLLSHQHSVPSIAVSTAVYTTLLGIRNTDIPNRGLGGEEAKQTRKKLVKSSNFFFLGMSRRGAKNSPVPFSDIQEVPRAIPVPADSRLRFSQLEFEAVTYVDYNILFVRNVTPFSLVGMYGLYGETWKRRDTFLYALTEGGRFAEYVEHVHTAGQRHKHLPDSPTFKRKYKDLHFRVCKQIGDFT